MVGDREESPVVHPGDPRMCVVRAYPTWAGQSQEKEQGHYNYEIGEAKTISYSLISLHQCLEI